MLILQRWQRKVRRINRAGTRARLHPSTARGKLEVSNYEKIVHEVHIYIDFWGNEVTFDREFWAYIEERGIYTFSFRGMEWQC